MRRARWSDVSEHDEQVTIDGSQVTEVEESFVDQRVRQPEVTSYTRNALQQRNEVAQQQQVEEISADEENTNRAARKISSDRHLNVASQHQRPIRQRSSETASEAIRRESRQLKRSRESQLALDNKGFARSRSPDRIPVGHQQSPDRDLSSRTSRPDSAPYPDVDDYLEKEDLARPAAEEIAEAEEYEEDFEEDDEEEDDEEQGEDEGRRLEYVLKKSRSHKRDVLQYTPICTRDPERMVLDKMVKIRMKRGLVENAVIATMYNEEPDELILTLRGICENLKKMTKHARDAEFWRSFVVCIVSDGREQMSKGTMEWFEEMGLISRDAMSQALETSDVGLHLFETKLIVQEDEETEKSFPPLQMMVAIKEHNAGKIDSHWWFFNGFAELMRPKYCYLLDIGTKPRKQSFTTFYNAFERDKRIAGVCGEITTRNNSGVLNPVVAAQHFEYKIATVLDKAMESVFGYISVLPGAFSAYRFSSLRGDPLRQYFHHISTPLAQISPFQANMYLAEDRILCYELVAKNGHDHLLHYCSGAVAETDVPETLEGLIKQRRRWLNGSFFALLYALINFDDLWKFTKHNFLRKCFITIQFLYFCLSVLGNWFVLGVFYLVFTLVLENSIADAQFSTVALILRYILVGIVMLLIIGGLGNSPREMRFLYVACSILFAALFALITGLTIVLVSTELQQSGGIPLFLLAGICITLGIYIVAAVLHGAVGSILTTIVQYVLLMPTFLLTLPIYSFCNVHDISWGTKGLAITVFDQPAKAVDPTGQGKRGSGRGSQIISKAAATETNDKKALAMKKRIMQAQQKAEKEKAEVASRFKKFRSHLVMCWLVSNAMLVVLISELRGYQAFVITLFVILAIINGARFIGSCTYVVKEIWYTTLNLGQTSMLVLNANRLKKARRESKEGDSHKGQKRALKQNDRLDHKSSTSEALRELEKDTPKNNSFGVLLFKIIFAPLRWQSYIAAFMTVFVALFGIFAAFWVIATGLVSSLLIWFYPLGTFLMAGSILSWRCLAYFDFIWHFSIIGQLPAIFKRAGIRPPTLLGDVKTRKYSPGCLGISNRLINHKRTWQTWLYFAFFKFIISIIASIVILGVAGIGIAALAGARNITGVEFIDTNIWKGMESIVGSGQSQSSGAVILGIIALWLALNLCIITYDISRYACASILGRPPPKTRRPKRLRKVVSGPSRAQRRIEK